MIIIYEGSSYIWSFFKSCYTCFYMGGKSHLMQPWVEHEDEFCKQPFVKFDIINFFFVIKIKFFNKSTLLLLHYLSVCHSLRFLFGNLNEKLVKDDDIPQ